MGPAGAHQHVNVLFRNPRAVGLPRQQLRLLRKRRDDHTPTNTLTRTQQMSLPPKLTFTDRLAPYAHPKKGNGHFFRCWRRGHPEFTTFVPGPKTEAIEFRNAHDFAHHNSIYRHIGFQPAKNAKIDQLASE